jgi:hypothetical protein
VKDKNNAPECCRGCRFWPLGLLSCAGWQLAYAINELKKAVPFVRRTAERKMQCREYAPAFEAKLGDKEEQP